MTEEQLEGPFLSPAKVAVYFDVKAPTVRKWITEGKIKAAKIGTDWRIPESEVFRLVQESYGDSK